MRAKPDKFVFILAGKWWQVEEIHFDEGRIYVKPFPDVPPPATWVAPHGREVSYRVAQEIKKLLESHDFPPYLQQAKAQDLLGTLRRRALAQGLDQGPLQFRHNPNDSCEVITYAGDRVNLLLSQLACKIKKWVCEDVTYASLRVKSRPRSEEHFEQSFLLFLKQLLQDMLLEDKLLLAELAAQYDDEASSKWSLWLPPKYRCQFLINRVFDVTSASMWVSRATETS